MANILLLFAEKNVSFHFALQKLLSFFCSKNINVFENILATTVYELIITLRKYAYLNILKVSPPKTGSFQIKNSDIFHISAPNIDCRYSLELPRRGSSNEYPQSMFLSKNKKNNVYPCKPQFYYIKVGFKGSNLYRYVFVMNWPVKLTML